MDDQEKNRADFDWLIGTMQEAGRPDQVPAHQDADGEDEAQR